MQRISLAPVLSATRSRDSCWITSELLRHAGSLERSLAELDSDATPGGAVDRTALLGALEDLDDPPPLRRRERPRLTDEDEVADAGDVALVVRLDLARAAQNLAVEGVLDAVLDLDDDGLVHLVADDVAAPLLAVAAGRRRLGGAGRVLCHLLLLRAGGDAELALAHDRVDPGDVTAYGAQPPVILQLPGGRLEPEVEQLLLGLAQFLEQTLVVEAAKALGNEVLGPDRHHASPPSRRTIRHFIGSLWIARVSASLATFSLGNDSSKSTRPGLTFATHPSGEPLPEPMRVSAGFFVSGRSG